MRLANDAEYEQLNATWANEFQNMLLRMSLKIEMHKKECILRSFRVFWTSLIEHFLFIFVVWIWFIFFLFFFLFLNLFFFLLFFF